MDAFFELVQQRRRLAFAGERAGIDAELSQDSRCRPVAGIALPRHRRHEVGQLNIAERERELQRIKCPRVALRMLREPLPQRGRAVVEMIELGAVTFVGRQRSCDSRRSLAPLAPALTAST